MDLYPAIDLLGGRVVRLRQGDYADETVYGDDPVAVARGFADEGAVWIHVVDLDAARSGDPVNRPVVAALVSALDGAAQVQTGGGVRSLDDARELADAGVARVVMGSAAVRDPSLVERASSVVPVAVGLDHRNGEVAVDGWTEGSGLMLEDACGRYPTADVFVITDIGRDGMLVGPDVEGLAAAVAGTVRVQTGGGVRSVDDARELSDAGVARVVMGSAAVHDPSLVAVASEIVPVAVGLDHRDGEVAVHGWTQGSGLLLDQAFERFPTAAVFVITDIGRDGMLVGPDVDGLTAAAELAGAPVIASGGVSSLADVVALSAIPNLGGIITGKAVYEGRFTVVEALAALAAAGSVSEPDPTP